MSLLLLCLMISKYIALIHKTILDKLNICVASLQKGPHVAKIKNEIFVDLKVIEKCPKNFNGYSRLALNNHGTNIYY